MYRQSKFIENFYEQHLYLSCKRCLGRQFCFGHVEILNFTLKITCKKSDWKIAPIVQKFPSTDLYTVSVLLQVIIEP